MLNTEILKKGEEPSHIDDEPEEFDDGEKSSTHKKWNKNYKVNLEPMDIVRGLPGFDKGAFYVEHYDPYNYTIESLD